MGRKRHKNIAEVSTGIDDTDILNIDDDDTSYTTSDAEENSPPPSDSKKRKQIDQANALKRMHQAEKGLKQAGDVLQKAVDLNKKLDNIKSLEELQKTITENFDYLALTCRDEADQGSNKMIIELILEGLEKLSKDDKFTYQSEKIANPHTIYDLWLSWAIKLTILFNLYKKNLTTKYIPDLVIDLFIEHVCKCYCQFPFNLNIKQDKIADLRNGIYVLFKRAMPVFFMSFTTAIFLLKENYVLSKYHDANKSMVFAEIIGTDLMETIRFRINNLIENYTEKNLADYFSAKHTRGANSWEEGHSRNLESLSFLFVLHALEKPPKEFINYLDKYCRDRKNGDFSQKMTTAEFIAYFRKYQESLLDQPNKNSAGASSSSSSSSAPLPIQNAGLPPPPKQQKNDLMLDP